jgi:hypothetical protein
MRIASAWSSGHFRKGPLLTIGAFIMGAVATYQSAQFVLSGDFTGFAFAGMALIGGTIVIGILNNWRNGVFFFGALWGLICSSF